MDESAVNESPSRRRAAGGCAAVGLVALVLLVLLVAAVARAISNVRDGITAEEWTTSALVAAIIAIVVVAVLVSALKERHAWAGRLAELGRALRTGAFAAYIGVLVLGLYAIVLSAAFATGPNQWVVEQAPLVQALILVALGAMAVVFLSRLLNRDRRGVLLTNLVDARLGWLLAPAFLVLAASVALTVSSALILVGADHQWWDLLAPDGSGPPSHVVGVEDLAYDALTSKLVLWEMLDLAPIVELPRTLAWEEPPLTYEDWGVGFVLLAVKGVAGVALLAAGKALFDAWAGRDDRRAGRATAPEVPATPTPF